MFKGCHFPSEITLETVRYYRAIDKFGDVIDYYLSPTRDEAAVKSFLNKAMVQNVLPEKIVIDGDTAVEQFYGLAGLLR